MLINIHSGLWQLSGWRLCPAAVTVEGSRHSVRRGCTDHDRYDHVDCQCNLYESGVQGVRRLFCCSGACDWTGFGPRCRQLTTPALLTTSATASTPPVSAVPRFRLRPRRWPLQKGAHARESTGRCGRLRDDVTTCTLSRTCGGATEREPRTTLQSIDVVTGRYDAACAAEPSCRRHQRVRCSELNLE